MPFAIVTPHFERPALLAETAASVRAALGAGDEWIVVDDGSTPDAQAAAAAVVQSVPGARFLVRKNGLKGPSACRNLGWRATAAPLVMFLDSDDLMAPWALRVREERAAAAGADLTVFPAMLFRDVPGDMDCVWNVMEGGDDAVRFAVGDGAWHTSSPVWKREALERVGGFNEKVFYGDDSDLHLRALVEGLAVVRHVDLLPDVFIRRSPHARITNDTAEALVRTRQVRLEEGAAFLFRHPAGARLLPWWEGQYFVEAEFLLFQHPRPHEPVREILGLWASRFKVPAARRTLVRAYFAAALTCRRRAYLVLRLCRRLAAAALPAPFFPPPSRQGAAVSPTVAAAVREAWTRQAS